MKPRAKEETLLLPSVPVIRCRLLDLPLTNQAGEVEAEAEVQTEEKTEIEKEIETEKEKGKEKGDRTRETKAEVLKETENALDRPTDEILHTETVTTTVIEIEKETVIDTGKETEDEIFINKTKEREYTQSLLVSEFSINNLIQATALAP